MTIAITSITPDVWLRLINSFYWPINQGDVKILNFQCEYDGDSPKIFFHVDWWIENPLGGKKISHSIRSLRRGCPNPDLSKIFPSTNVLSDNPMFLKTIGYLFMEAVKFYWSWDRLKPEASSAWRWSNFGCTKEERRCRREATSISSGPTSALQLLFFEKKPKNV